MGNVVITVDLPESVSTAMGVRLTELAPVLREAFAVELYRMGRLSLGKAAEIAGVTRLEMLPILAKHDVWFAYDVYDAAADWETLQETLPR